MEGWHSAVYACDLGVEKTVNESADCAKYLKNPRAKAQSAAVIAIDSHS
jgi:hypothetical protein